MKTGNLFFQLMILVFCFGNIAAQPTADPILFSYGDNQVSRSEFEYFFNKSNFGKTNISEQDIRDNLELYINFKLKVKEAEDLLIDTLPAVHIDLTNYIEQLFQSYIDKEVMNHLIEEAYERLQSDVRVSHILVNLNANASPQDTLAAYNKAIEIRNRLLKGEDFSTVALEESGDQYVKNNKGDLGYLTAMQVPFYNFENTMYSMPLGQISMPVRTKLGYHLIKVTDKRPAMGTFQVAHVLIAMREDAPASEKEEKKKKADEVYKLLMDGVAFEQVVLEYSEDKSTVSKGGLLDPFGAGRMIPKFEETTIGLKNDGDISQPVETRYGWHIIKRVSHADIAPLEEIRADLKSKITKSERYLLSRNMLLSKYKVAYSFIEFQDKVKELANEVDSSILKGNWYPKLENGNDKPIFIIGEKTATQNDLVNFISTNFKTYGQSSLENVFDYHYGKFKEKTILEYGLNDRYDEFLKLKQEYREGIIMFALMEQKVWNKAVLDTAGLMAYYEATKNEHLATESRIDWTKFICVNRPKIVKYVRKIAKKPMTNPAYLAQFETDKEKIYYKYYQPTDEEKAKAIEQGSIAQTFIRIQNETYYKKGKIAELDNIDWKEGALSANEVKIDTVNSANSSISFYRISRVIPPGPVELQEARGIFVDGFQKQLDREWVISLREKYPVLINEEILKTLIK